MDARVSSDVFLFGQFRLDRLGGGLFRCAAGGGPEPITLGSRALDVLFTLLERNGQLVSKDEIMAAVWPDTIVEDANLPVQISALRRALDAGRSDGSWLQTVPGRGYRFVGEVTRRSPYAPMTPLPAAGENSAVAALPAPQQDRMWPKHALPRATQRLLIIAVLAILGATTGVWFWREHAPATVPPRLSLVVLPFENSGGVADDDYLAAGITDDLTAALSHIPGAVVIARATALTYRGKAEDIRGIGRDLGVRYVVNGSVQRLGTGLRVSAELGSTETGAQLWSDNFDQKIADLATGQEQIAVRMQAALNVSLADIEAARSLRERPTDPDAFDLILRARAIRWLPQTKVTQTKALELYEQALAHDPNAVVALTGAVNVLLALYFVDAMPYDVAMDRAVQYLERARKLEPNAEAVLAAQSEVLDYQQENLNYRRVRLELESVARKLIDLYPNNTDGYFHLGVIRRNQGRYDEAARLFETTIRLNPRGPTIKNNYWNMAWCEIRSRHDREGLEWADRATAAEGALPSWRVARLLGLRAAAYVRTGNLDTGKRIARELNDRFPFDTWRRHVPEDPNSEKNAAEIRSLQEALKAAGNRDHADPDADFGVAPVDVLHLEFEGKTPTTAPGVTTVNTEQLAGMLRDTKPLVIDTMEFTWNRSIPGAVGLDFNGNTQGSFTDEVQKRVEAKLRELTSGDMAKPIVAVGWSSESFDGYNLALRLRHAGYTNVHWYRGGREAWEVAGRPEDVVRPAIW